jgi:hypothetical protein
MAASQTSERRLANGSCGLFAAVTLVAIAISVLIVLGSADASAHAGAAPDGTPSVLCTQATFPGRLKPTTPSEYSFRPGRCKLPASTSPGGEQSTNLLAIQWRNWTARSALGTAEIPIIEEHLATGERREGRERVTVRLSRPRSRCGRVVFTRAYVKWFFGGGINYHYRLHSVPVVGQACPSMR